MTSPQLREKLRELSNCTQEELAAHPRMVEELRKDCLHSIRFIEKGEARSLCFDYAFGIDAGIAGFAYQMIVIDPKVRDQFVSNFVKVNVLPSLDPVELCPRDGDIVIYFQKDNPTHAGIWKAGRVISKWGRCPIYEHEIGEVPITYGDQTRTFVRPDSDAITMKFVEYIRGYTQYPVFKTAFEQKVAEYNARRRGSQGRPNTTE